LSHRPYLPLDPPPDVRTGIADLLRTQCNFTHSFVSLMRLLVARFHDADIDRDQSSRDCWYLRFAAPINAMSGLFRAVENRRLYSDQTLKPTQVSLLRVQRQCVSELAGEVD
jgi:hypothetical protein